MRKALIAAAVATALFAVGAFAAQLNVRSEDVASGTDPVAACAPQVDIDFDPPDLSPTTGVWTVDGATVTFLNASDVATDTCDRFDARLAIQTGATTFTQVGTLADVGLTGTGIATFSFAPTNVVSIIGASVVVDGATLSADLP